MADDIDKRLTDEARPRSNESAHGSGDRARVDECLARTARGSVADIAPVVPANRPLEPLDGGGARSGSARDGGSLGEDGAPALGEFGHAAREEIADVVDVFPDDSELTGADSLRRVRIRRRENQLAVRGKALGRGGEDHVEVRYVLD